MIFSIIPNLENGQDLLNLRNVSPEVAEKMEDLSRWNLLIEKEFGQQFIIDPVKIYARLMDARTQARNFLQKRNRTIPIYIYPSELSQEVLNRIEDLIEEEGYSVDLKEENRSMMLYPDGRYEIIRPDVIGHIEFEGKMNPETIIEMLMLIPPEHLH